MPSTGRPSPIRATSMSTKVSVLRPCPCPELNCQKANITRTARARRNSALVRADLDAALFRPCLRCHRRGIRADQLVEASMSSAPQFAGEEALDLADHREPAEHQRRVDLHQASPGPDLGERSLAGI